MGRSTEEILQEIQERFLSRERHILDLEAALEKERAKNQIMEASLRRMFELASDRIRPESSLDDVRKIMESAPPPECAPPTFREPMVGVMDAQMKRLAGLQLDAIEKTIEELGGPIVRGGPVITRGEVPFCLLPPGTLSRTLLLGAGGRELGRVELVEEHRNGNIVFEVKTWKQPA